MRPLCCGHPPWHEKEYPCRPQLQPYLFDMDGTILYFIAAAERVWAERHGLDVAAFPTIHGVRGIETIARLALPGVDPAAEAHAILLAEIVDVDGVVAIDGAAAFLAALPADRWAIVTSAPRPLALRRLAAAALPTPACAGNRRGRPARQASTRSGGTATARRRLNPTIPRVAATVRSTLSLYTQSLPISRLSYQLLQSRLFRSYWQASTSYLIQCKIILQYL